MGEEVSSTPPNFNAAKGPFARRGSEHFADAADAVGDDRSGAFAAADEPAPPGRDAHGVAEAEAAGPARAPDRRGRLGRDPAEGEGLDPDPARAAQGGEEAAFVAEQASLDRAPHAVLHDVHLDLRLVRRDAAAVDMNDLAGLELALDDRAADVEEGPARAGQLLHDEAFVAEDGRAKAALHGDRDADSAGGGEKGVALADQASAHRLELHRNDLARRAAADRKPRLALRAGVLELGEEHIFARHGVLRGAGQLGSKPGVGPAAVAEDHG